MYRFFVPVEQIHGGHAQITGDDVNHIRNVLRMEIGEKIVISGGQGTDYYCIIKDVQPESIMLEIEREEPVRTELPVSCVLFQALPKADKMEWIIQKAVELGVCGGQAERPGKYTRGSFGNVISGSSAICGAAGALHHSV